MFIIKIFLFLLFWIPQIKCATLNCTFVGNACNNFTLSSVIQWDEAIVVNGAPFTPFVDNITDTIGWVGRTIPSFQEFPRRIFDIFVNLRIFMTQSNSKTTEFLADTIHNCANLGYVHIYNTITERLGSGFARTCSNLKGLYFASCQIKTIDENAFQGLSSLEDLQLTFNYITCIPPMLFQPTKNIYQLTMFGNYFLTGIHSDLFVGLTKLRGVYLLDCGLTYIPNFNLNTTSTDVSVTNGLLINLNGNPIQAISPDLVLYLSLVRPKALIKFIPIDQYNQPVNISTCIDPTKISNLTQDAYIFGNTTDGSNDHFFFTTQTTCYSSFTADMASNYLASCQSTTTTSTTTFAPTTSTSMTTSSSTLEPITTTSTSTTESTTSTSTTELTTTSEDPITSTEPITSPSPDTPPSDIIFPPSPAPTTVPPIQCATDKICRFYLNWNNLYTCVIDGAEGTVTSISGAHYLNYVDADVKRVYFLNSFLNLVPNILFQKFPNLNYLHISNCGLSVINDQTFNQCGNLEFLDASHNQITRVEETALRNCTKLRVIDLTGNSVDFVSGGLYQLDPALERIHLKRLDDWILA